MHLRHSLRKLELTLKDFMPQLPQTTLVEIQLSIEQFKVDRPQITVVAKNIYISTCRNCSAPLNLIPIAEHFRSSHPPCKQSQHIVTDNTYK